jgi:ubiquinone/menaquinone biosynthesis C-methylase UbiE
MCDYFDLMASFYDRVIGPPDTERLSRLLQLPTEGWLLDAGGGTGRVSGRLRGLVGRLVINDLSHRMLKKASQKDICTVRAHAEKLPFADERFARVLVVDALHHFCDQRQAISDLLRVLKPRGRLVIEEPDLNHKGVKLMSLFEKILMMRSRFHSPAKIRDMVLACGVPAKIESDGRYTAWIVAEKKSAPAGK